jgi:hypothetical protein
MQFATTLHNKREITSDNPPSIDLYPTGKSVEIQNVPDGYNDAGNPHLGYWVSRQRKNYAKGSLGQEKIDQLELVGFVWKMEGEVVLEMNRDDDL